MKLLTSILNHVVSYPIGQVVVSSLLAPDKALSSIESIQGQ
jgi:hypothetical protein